MYFIIHLMLLAISRHNDAHLIIYRITDERIEVLDIIHAASSISKIRGVRNVRL